MIRILLYSFLSCFFAWIFSVSHLGIVMLLASQTGDYFVVIIWAGVTIFFIWLVIVWPFYLWVPTSSFLWQKKVAIPLGMASGIIVMLLMGIGELLTSWHILLDIIAIGALIPWISIAVFREKVSVEGGSF